MHSSGQQKEVRRAEFKETKPRCVIFPSSGSADGKRHRSAVWHYFVKTEGAGTSQCNVCAEIVKHANNTSNLFKVIM